MMNRLFSVAVVAAVAIVLGACSKDSGTTPPPTSTGGYLVTTAGSYWVYDMFTLSGDSASPTVTPAGTDSMAVMGPSTQGGLACTAYNNFTPDSTGAITKDTTYMREEGGKIYTYYPLQLSGVAGLAALDFGTKWVVVADENNATWTSFDTTLTNVPIDYNGLDLTATIKMNIGGKKFGMETVNVAGKSYEALHCMMNVSINIDVTLTQVPVTIPIHYWIVKGVGVVKTEQSPQQLVISLAPAPIPVPGSRNTLNRYVVK